MPNDTTFLLDSDFLVGYFIADDAHHARAIQRVRQLDQLMPRLFVNNLVVVETATLLSKRGHHHTAQKFLAYIRSAEFDVVYVDDALQQAAEQLFASQKKVASLVDCANVVLAQNMEITNLLAFDKFYGEFDLSYIRAS
jgi:predicted nucleic acid-binding protein